MLFSFFRNEISRRLGRFPPQPQRGLVKSTVRCQCTLLTDDRSWYDSTRQGTRRSCAVWILGSDPERILVSLDQSLNGPPRPCWVDVRCYPPPPAAWYRRLAGSRGLAVTLFDDVPGERDASSVTWRLPAERDRVPSDTICA